MLKSVRIWYKKTGRAKYISHLDLNRCMIRVIQRAKIPVWRTEGFNPHAFVTFALPLSLGFSGKCESMDIKLISDMPFDEIISRMNKYLPEGIEVYDVREPVMKPGDIETALFEIKLTSDDVKSSEIESMIHSFLGKDSIIVSKKTKSGIKDIDLKPFITDYTVKDYSDFVKITIKLPAGSNVNINPSLIFDAFVSEAKCDIYTEIKRMNLFNKDGEIFR